jgi:RNA polymerase sigma-70 factor (ECF subfamily)
MISSDEQLMLQYQRGSREAFEELFARHRDMVYRFFRRRLDYPARAEELAQETFLAVIRGTTRYQPRSAFRTYLLAIAFNLLNSERRRREEMPKSEKSPSDVGASEDRSDERLWVRKAVESLDEPLREVLMLREYEQLSYEEIAATLRLPLNTVRTRLFRARMALKEALLAGRNRQSSPADAD